MLYMSSSFWLLQVESCDFSQAEKDSTANKDEQTHKMTTSFTQSGPRLSFWVKIIAILGICSALQAVLSFSAWEKSGHSTRNSQNPEDMLAQKRLETQILNVIYLGTYSTLVYWDRML